MRDIDIEQLSRLIAMCKGHGLSGLTVGDLSVQFYPDVPVVHEAPVAKQPDEDEFLHPYTNLPMGPEELALHRRLQAAGHFDRKDD